MIRRIAADGRTVHFLFHFDTPSWRRLTDHGVTLPAIRASVSNALATFGGVPTKLAVEVFENVVNDDVLGGMVEMVPTREMVFGMETLATQPDPSTVDNVLLIAVNQPLAAAGVNFSGEGPLAFHGHVTGLLSDVESTNDIGYGPFPPGTHPTASATVSGGVTSSLSTVVSEDADRNNHSVFVGAANQALPTLEVPTWVKVTAVAAACIGGILVTAGVLGYAARGGAQLLRES